MPPRFIISSRIKRHPQKWDPKSLQFMSISELRQIQDVFDIQSHTHFLHRVDAAGGRFYSVAITIIFCLISPARAGR
ncbi:Polysaccharide deacetylase [Klebsiella pneumoniae IS53]|nr:Polysaccharide deacetylase [Klebsiella pneumoniae IS53]